MEAYIKLFVFLGVCILGLILGWMSAEHEGKKEKLSGSTMENGFKILKNALGVKGTLEFLSSINPEYEDYLNDYDPSKDTDKHDYLDYILEDHENWEAKMSEPLIPVVKDLPAIKSADKSSFGALHEYTNPDMIKYESYSYLNAMNGLIIFWDESEDAWTALYAGKVMVDSSFDGLISRLKQDAPEVIKIHGE